MGYETLSGRATVYNPHDAPTSSRDEEAQLTAFYLMDEQAAFMTFVASEDIWGDELDAIHRAIIEDPQEASHRAREAVKKWAPHVAERNVLHREFPEGFEHDEDYAQIARRLAS